MLPADIYDALELSALAFGGIGRGIDWLNDSEGATCPICVHGHANYLEDGTDAISRALYEAGISRYENDKRIVGSGGRISWATYCRRGNIVRGEDQ